MIHVGGPVPLYIQRCHFSEAPVLTSCSRLFHSHTQHAIPSSSLYLASVNLTQSRCLRVVRMYMRSVARYLRMQKYDVALC
jgi:hypothetical protein